MIHLSKLEMIVGLFMIGTGIPYGLRLFGQTESIVVTWGVLAILLGGMLVFFGLYKGMSDYLKIVLAFLLVLMQTPPIFLWFTFHGAGITDGTPNSDFVAHWLFSLPHIAIILLGMVLIVSLFKRNTT